MSGADKKIIRQEVEVEELPGVDVIVAGGGTAGVAAALAAARCGAEVMLIERYGYLGGMMTAGNAGLTMYTKYSGDAAEHAKDEKALSEDPAAVQIAGGIAAEITRRLLASGAGRGNCGTFGNYVLTSSEDFKRLLFQMMKEAKVKLRLHSLVVDVMQRDGTLQGVVLESKSGRQFVPARQFVDATGDGDVAARAGVPYTVGVTEDDLCAKAVKIGEMQTVGVMFKAGNVDLKETFAWLERHPERFVEHPFARFSFATTKKNFENGEVATMTVSHGAPDDLVQIYNLPTKGVVTLCCPLIKDMDGCDVEDLTRAEIIMADMVKRWVDRISATIPGFEGIFLLDCPQIGVRETRRVQGEYVLGLMDIFKQREFEDCIGFGSHPVDTHPRPEWLHDTKTAYPSRWFFQIPYRCLVAKGKENLLVAGRCVSATHEAFGCVRATVQCMIMGEAAGTAAAMCVEANVAPRELSPLKLRGKLKEAGALC